ncbi:MAG: HlyC/CorC family transporter [Chromatiales bacterium]|nr:HlyC/CorC family transporter [Chromatiales bacterium]
MLNDIPIWVLTGLIAFLILVSAFFSGSETGLISLNRYRLRHMARDGHAGAKRAHELLKRPDRLIGLILLGNNFVNILASVLAGVLAARLVSESIAPLVATAVLTPLVLIFAEITPKTLAAIRPERFAFPATSILRPLGWVLSPFVTLFNTIPSALLRLFGVSQQELSEHTIGQEELRTVVNEAGAMIPQRHQRMLLGILDLEKATVEDIMVPRNEIVGIDLEDEWEQILTQLRTSQHTRLPVYRGDIDQVIGILHLRNLLGQLHKAEFTREGLEQLVRESYFIPEGTPLNTQLLNFQSQRRRIGMVVDEYGDIQGLVTLDDILEEIVGEFTTDPSTSSKDIHPQEDGSFLVDGSANIRELNRIMKWELPTDGPKTLNGMITEYLETIPETGTSLLLEGYPIDIVQTGANTVKTVRIDPSLRKGPEASIVSS